MLWSQFAFDKDGNPVLIDVDELLLANAKFNKSKSNVSGSSRLTRSGNPWFDPSSGRFANGPVGVSIRGGGELLKNLLNSSKAYISTVAQRTEADALIARPGKQGRIQIVLYKMGTEIGNFEVPGKQATPSETPGHEAEPAPEVKPHVNVNSPSTVPPGVDPEEWARRLDAVRAAAREFDPQKVGDIREFLQGKTNRSLTPEELTAFMEDVRRARLDDLVDVLDHSIRRREESRVRGRRTIRVVPPRGWLRKTMAGLTNDEVVELHRRLQARGFDEKELQTHLVNRFPEQRRMQIEARVGTAVEGGNESTTSKGSSSTNRR